MRKATLAAGIATLLALAGCSDSGDDTSSDAPRETTQASQAVPSDDPSTDAPAGPAFGEPWAVDGLTVTVAAPQPYTPSPTAADVVDGYTNLAFHVTVTNDGSEAYDAYGFDATVLSGSKEGAKIYDTANNVGAPSVSVPAGKSVEFDLAFSVADPADISMTVEPVFLGEEYTISTD